MTGTTNITGEAGIRKAAIFVSSLDQATADRLLDQLSPACAALVREAMMSMDRLDAGQRQPVIEEFRRIENMIPDQSPPGIDLDGPLAEQFSRNCHSEVSDCHPERSEGSGANSDEILRCAQDDSRYAQDDGAAPFGFLCEAEEEKLLQLLASERPQTIALVLSHLPSPRAGEVLTRLAPPLQVEIVRRLAELEHTDPETLREIEQTLEARLSRQFASERPRTAGPETVAKILAACDQNAVGNLLNNLAEYDETLAKQLGRRTIEFDDLVGLDDATLMAIFQAAEPEVALAALLGAPPLLVARLLRQMDPAAAKHLHRKLNCPGPILLSDVDEARGQIAALAQRMSHGKPLKTARAA